MKSALALAHWTGVLHCKSSMSFLINSMCRWKLGSRQQAPEKHEKYVTGKKNKKSVVPLLFQSSRHKKNGLTCILAFLFFVRYVWVWFVKGICIIERGNQRGGKCISVWMSSRKLWWLLRAHQDKKRRCGGIGVLSFFHVQRHLLIFFTSCPSQVAGLADWRRCGSVAQKTRKRNFIGSIGKYLLFTGSARCDQQKIRR